MFYDLRDDWPVPDVVEVVRHVVYHGHAELSELFTGRHPVLSLLGQSVNSLNCRYGVRQVTKQYKLRRCRHSAPN